MIKLYDYILSSDCYKVRLLLALLGLKYETAKVNVHPGRDNELPAFLAVNPLATLPALEDSGLVLRDSQAILTYLALRYDESRSWLPADPALAGQIAMWLAFAGTELDGLTRLRMLGITGVHTDTTSLRAGTRRALAILEDHLVEREIAGCRWMVGDAPSIADLAVYPPVALAPDAGVAMHEYPAVWRWVDHVKRIPGMIIMPGIMPILPGTH